MSLRSTSLSALSSGTRLIDLPNELIVEIIRNFSSIRSYETQWTAFHFEDEEMSRQRENSILRYSLHSLCLTSRQLRSLATPFLYASFIGATTAQSWDALQLYYRTVSTSHLALDATTRLATYLEYTEIRGQDYRGHSIITDFQWKEAFSMLKSYYSLLSDVLRQAINLRHLCVVSVETDDISLWQHLIPRYDSLAEEQQSTRERLSMEAQVLGKLKIAAVQVQTIEDPRIRAPAQAILKTLASSSCLADLRTSGLVIHKGMNGGDSLEGPFKHLKHLETTICALDLADVVTLLESCRDLRDITLSWSRLDVEYLGLDASTLEPESLLPGLLQHASTLERLHLDMRNVRYSRQFKKNAAQLGSLRAFPVLKSLTMCQQSLLGHNRRADAGDKLSQPLSALLPADLQNFTLLLLDSPTPRAADYFGRAFDEWDLPNDIRLNLKELKEFNIESDNYHDFAMYETWEELREMGLSVNAISKAKGAWEIESD